MMDGSQERGGFHRGQLSTIEDLCLLGGLVYLGGSFESSQTGPFVLFSKWTIFKQSLLFL